MSIFCWNGNKRTMKIHKSIPIKKKVKGGIAKFEEMWVDKLREYSNFSGIFFHLKISKIMAYYRKIQIQNFLDLIKSA